MSTLDRPGGTALLVIDLQDGVLATCTDVDGVLERTARLLARARANGTPVVHVQHEDPGLRPGSPDWQLAAAVRPVGDEPVVAKRYRDAFAGTGLAALLEGYGVDRLVVAGAQSDYCVRSTSLRAAAEGYDVTLVSDCHTTEDVDAEGEHLTGAQIVAHTTATFAGLRYPGQAFAAEPHDTVRL